MIALKIGIVYCLDLTDKVQLGPISKQTLYERLTDGRISGLLAEDLANALYNNMTKAPSQNSGFDLFDSEGRKYECRTVTRGGTNLVPAVQIGAGRKIDLAKHQEKLDYLYAYVFVDVRNSPLFRLVAIEVERLESRLRITPSEFEQLINELPTKNI